VKTIALILAAFLLAIQAQLWFGKGGLARGVQLRAQLKTQEEANDQARARNARLELGMVRPDEIYVQLQQQRH